MFFYSLYFLPLWNQGSNHQTLWLQANEKALIYSLFTLPYSMFASPGVVGVGLIADDHWVGYPRTLGLGRAGYKNHPNKRKGLEK